jgi:hypothetical protein
MTVPTLLRILRARGITLWLEGERVRGRVLKGPLTASDQALLATHRTALVTWLRQQTVEGSAGPVAGLPEPPCPPHVSYAPLPSEGPLRQCQTCSHVWSVACACGSTRWQCHVETETWSCRACGAWYGEQPASPRPR